MPIKVSESTAMRITIVGFVLLGCLPFSLQAVPDDAPDEALKAAKDLFACPDAKWNLVKQSFWRHHTVLKLTACKWPHRPTVVVDEQQSARMLTDGVQRVPEESTLNEFNRAAKSESVVIDTNNVSDYLQFFVNSHLNWCDGLYFGANTMARKVKHTWQLSDVRNLAEKIESLKAELAPFGDIPVRELRDKHEFKATVFEWRPAWKPPAIHRFDITIHSKGTIEVTSAWIRRTTSQHSR